MCLLGGKNEHHAYLNSIELVSETSCRLLNENNNALLLSLPVPMACFGVATIADRVYLFGGKSQESTLTSVYETQLSYFIDASEGKDIKLNDDYDGDNDTTASTTIWKKVGTLGSDTTPAPRHSFSVVVEGDVCWLMGGFDGTDLLHTVGLYHTKYHMYVDHPHHLNVARSGPSSFLLGQNCIMVTGGIAYPNEVGDIRPFDRDNDLVSPTAATSELLVRFDGGKEDIQNEVFVQLPKLNCPQKDQGVFRLGYGLYAIGQFNFDNQGPTCTIACLDLMNLPEEFQLEQDHDGVVVGNDFPVPIVPIEPVDPKLSSDITKLQHSVSEWKRSIQGKKQEYSTNVNNAILKSQRIHDKTVASWTQEMSNKQQALDASQPKHLEQHARQVLNGKLHALRLEFEQQTRKLEEEAKEQLRHRKKESEAQVIRYSAQIRSLEHRTAEYNNRLQQHQHQMLDDLSRWVQAKESDVINMEKIVRDATTAPKQMKNSDCDVDLSEDREKMRSVFLGLNFEPVMVSNAYGIHCTNNYDVMNQIGTGNFGSVFRGTDRILQRSFAFKRMTVNVTNLYSSEERLTAFQQEISVSDPAVDNCIIVLFLLINSLPFFLDSKKSSTPKHRCFIWVLHGSKIR